MKRLYTPSWHPRNERDECMQPMTGYKEEGAECTSPRFDVTRRKQGQRDEVVFHSSACPLDGIRALRARSADSLGSVILHLRLVLY